MRWSQSLIPTMKETPEGAEIPSHVLMLRAGLIGQLMAGVYSYLPLGLRTLRKVEAIVRDEMDRAGAVELLLPALTPLSLWERTNRVEAFGNVLMQFKVRRKNHEVAVALGPTHEEIITELVSRHISSYRQLPITLYQIQTKFRNEERPRFGVLRTSEFLMKDAYSFDTSVEALNASYQKMYDAYCKIFSRCGLDYLAVEAESGPIGGDASHEFMVAAENGEDSVMHCQNCGYAANVERAEIGSRPSMPSMRAPAEQREVATPGATTIEQVTKFLKCSAEQMIKTLIYTADGEPLAVLLRGDHEANEAKIRRASGASKIELAPQEVIEKATGAPVGFAGPVGLKIRILADVDVEFLSDAVTGANRGGYHLTGVNRPRDYEVERFADLRNATEGDPCPRCGAQLALRKAIEVGHVFKLGTKYSEALAARFLDASEQQHPIIMGCYGIGINRIMASQIETRHDANGIVWPMSIAPYEVVVSPINVTDGEVMRVAETLYTELQSAGVDVILDDRDQRPGVKFKDADLVGIPLRVVLGDRGLKAGQIELKWRWEKEPRMVPATQASERIARLVAEARQGPPYATPE